MFKQESDDYYDTLCNAVFKDLWGEEFLNRNSSVKPETKEYPDELMVESVESENTDIFWDVVSTNPKDYQMLEIAIPGVNKHQFKSSKKNSVLTIQISKLNSGNYKSVSKYCPSFKIPQTIVVILRQDVEVDRLEYVDGLLRIRLVSGYATTTEYVVM